MSYLSLPSGAPHTAVAGVLRIHLVHFLRKLTTRGENANTATPLAHSLGLFAPRIPSIDSAMTTSAAHVTTFQPNALLSAVRQRRALRRVGTTTRASLMPSDDSSSTQPSRRQIFGTGLAAAIVVSLPSGARAEGETFKNPSDLGDGYLRFYGEATTSSSYGGYGGNENNFDKFKYYYDIPQGWTVDTVNKFEKSTNGTDSRWSNPKSSGEKVYCVTLTGYNRLKEDRQGILSDLALSDYNLQDAIVAADSVEVVDRDVNGQTYVDFDLYGFFGAIFASVTVYGGRLYAVFSVVPDTLVEKDKEQAKRLRNSFGTISKDDEQTQYDLEFYKRS